jgi:hypothetical protein
VQRFRNKQRHQIGLHLFHRVGIVLQRLVELATVFRSIDAEVMAHFMPQRAIEVSVRREFLCLLFAESLLQSVFDVPSKIF